jgi:hypothetical protein
MEENGNGKSRGGWKDRTPWPKYTPEELHLLREKLSSWDDLKFMQDYWNVVYDEKDLAQYRRLADVWRLREQGRQQHEIAATFGIDQALVSRTVSGFKWRPNLVQMYLNLAKLGRPQEGRKWILDCTPKPTNHYPRALQVPERIRSYEDILEFLKQFPPVSEESEALRFFGLTSAWAEEHKAELFWFLLGFLVGDMGKQYVHNEYRARHYRKTAMTTRMARKDSNLKVLRYVQLALESLGILSHQVHSEDGVVRWNSISSNLLTWMIQVCTGLKEGETTSAHKLDMPWMKNSPKNLIIAFLQGLADSDGSIDTYGYYASIASVPNSTFYKELFEKLGVDAHTYTQEKPQQVRILLQHAVQLSLFNPIVRSYRYELLMQHAIRRKIIPPPPSFSSNQLFRLLIKYQTGIWFLI